MCYDVCMNKVNQRFGKLLVIEKIKSRFIGGMLRGTYRCKCDCGKIVIRINQNLNNRHVGNCGCYSRELISKIGKIKGASRFWTYKHGMFGTRFYNIYRNIIDRCKNKKNISYRFYGKIGIKNEFKDFEHFYNTMYKSYQEHIKKYGIKQTTIERIDSSKNYSPSNCGWATYTEQANNRKNNLFIEYKGKRKTLADWSKLFGTTKHITYHKLTGLNYNTDKPNKNDII